MYDDPTSTPNPTYWQDLVEHAKRGLDRDANPLHIWWIILAAVQQAEMEQLQKWELPYAKRQENARNALPLPLPRWVWDYLSSVAWRLGELAEGRDWMKRPLADSETVIDPSRPETMEPWNEYRETTSATPERAIELLPQAMHLTKKGKNYFKDWQSLKKKRDINETVLQKTREGMTISAATIETMEENGYGNIDSFRRLVRQGRHSWADE